MRLEQSEYPPFGSLNHRVVKGPATWINRLLDILSKVEYTKENAE
jgi:hypothetical protein